MPLAKVRLIPPVFGQSSTYMIRIESQCLKRLHTSGTPFNAAIEAGLDQTDNAVIAPSSPYISEIN